MKTHGAWHISRLGEIARIERGRFSQRPRNDPAFYGGDTPFIQTGDVSNAKLGVIRSYSQTLNKRGLAVSKMFPKGTLMISIAANIGDAAALGFDSACPDSVIAITSGAGMNSEYLRYYLRTQQRWIQYLAPSGAQKNINVEFLEDIEVEYPALPEQRKIAEILTTWDEALEKLDTFIESKERHKKALMQQLLRGEKRIPGFTKPWVSMRFEELLIQQDRYVEFDDDHTYSLVSIRRRSGGVFFREALKGSEIKTKVMKLVHKGDFLISRMQVVHGALGMVRPVCDGMYGSDSYEVLVAKDPKQLYMPFLDWMSRLRSFWHLTYICSHGVHIEKMTFNLDDFMHEKITIPGDIEEQRRIAAILDTCDEELNLLRVQRTALDQQKRGLMQRLLTGKIRVLP